jgi:hypothetical protein
MSQPGGCIEFGTRWLLYFVRRLPAPGRGQRSFSANKFYRQYARRKLAMHSGKLEVHFQLAAFLILTMQ